MGTTDKILRALAGIALFTGATLFILWRIPYGYGDIDECFPIATAYRLCLGDALVSEEWFLGQFSQMLMWPFVYLYLHIVGSLEGIVIASRYLYAVIIIFTGLFHFVVWKKHGYYGAMVGAVALILYAPFSLMVFAYYSIEIICFSIVLSLLMTGGGNSRLRFIFIGVFFALSVLGDPYLAVLYFIYLGYEVAIGRNTYRWIYVTTGLSIVALPVVACVLIRTSPQEITESLDYILNAPSHPHETLLVIVKSWIKAILMQQQLWITPLIMSVIGCVAIGGRSLQRVCCKARDLSCIIIVFLCAVWLCFAVSLSRCTFPDFLMFPVVFCALFIFLLLLPAISDICDFEKKCLLCFCGAIACSFCSCAASNQDGIRISQCMVVMLVPSVVIIFNLCHKLQYGKLHRSMVVGCSVFSACLIGGLCFLRYSVVFWDGPMDNKDTRITEGTHKGVITSKEKATMHIQKVAEIKNILDQYKDGRVMFTGGDTVGHIIAEREFGTCSAWIDGEGRQAFEKIVAWNRLHPNKQAELIFFRKKDEELLDDLLQYGYRVCGNVLDCPVLSRVHHGVNGPELKQ